MSICKFKARSSRVALLTEGVGRNYYCQGGRPPQGVALLTEGVGRNLDNIAASASAT